MTKSKYPRSSQFGAQKIQCKNDAVCGPDIISDAYSGNPVPNITKVTEVTGVTKVTKEVPVSLDLQATKVTKVTKVIRAFGSRAYNFQLNHRGKRKMKKREYINRYGKKAYFVMLLQTRERGRINRGFKNSGKGRKILYHSVEDL